MGAVKSLPDRLREASGYALMDAARVTVLEAAAEIERLRGSTVEQRFCEPPVAGSTPAAGFTIRDHFAAAALSGLLAASDANSWADDLWADDLCRTAYGWADSMLHQRGNQPEPPVSSPVTESMPKEKRAEVSDGRPVAWGLPNADGDEIWATSLNKEAIEQHCPTNQTLVPLYRSPQSTLTDEEREAIVQAIGLADWHKAYFSHLKQGEPLPSSTLRGLLERLK